MSPTREEVELAERYAEALTKIEEAGEVTADDVELAERYATALQAIEDGPDVSGPDVDEAERRAAGGSAEARLENLLRARAKESGFRLASRDNGFVLTRGGYRIRDTVSGLTPAEMSEEERRKACFELTYDGSDYVVVNPGNFEDCGIDLGADRRFTLQLWELADALGVSHEHAVADLMAEWDPEIYGESEE